MHTGNHGVIYIYIYIYIYVWHIIYFFVLYISENKRKIKKIKQNN